MSDTLTPDQAYEQAGQTYNIDPTLLRSITHVESGDDDSAVSPKGAKGRAQLMPGTASDLGVTDPTDPVQAIYGAAAYMRQNLDRTNGNVPLALAQYNAGPNGDPSNPETQAYIPKVAAKYAQLASVEPSQAAQAVDTAAPLDPVKASNASQDALWGVGGGTAAAPVDHSADVAAQDKAWGVTSSTAASPAPAAGPQDPGDLPAPETGLVPPPASPGGVVGNVAAGFMHGAVTAPGQLWSKVQAAGDKAVPVLGELDAGLGETPEEQTQQANMLAARDADYQAGAGKTLSGQVGNFLGNSVVTAPAYALGGAAIGGAAKLAASGVSNVPMLGTMAARGAQLLAGEGGSTLAGKAAAGAVSGGALGAGAAAVQGENAGQIGMGALYGAGGGSIAGGAGYAAGKLGNLLGPRAPQPPGATPELLASETGPASTNTPGVDVPPPVLSQPGVQQLTATLPPAPMGLGSSPGAQADRADDVIRHFNGGSDPVPVANPENSIPGVQLSAGAMTGNAGVASLENTFRQNPLYKNLFQAQDASNLTARLGFLQGTVGTPQDLADMTAARASGAADTAATMFANKTPTDPQPAFDTIDGILAGPDGKRDQIVSAMQNIRSKLFSGEDADGNPIPETDPEMLYGVRKAIGDQMSKLPANATSTPAAKAALMQVQNSLDDVIEEGAPGFADFRAQYSAASRPIDQATYLQNLFTPQLSGGQKNITAQQMNSALTKIIRGQATQGPTADVQSVTPETIAALTRLRNNLQVEGNMASAANGRGSSTFGNFATNAVMGNIAGGGNPLSLSNLALSGGAAAVEGTTGALGPLGYAVGPMLAGARHALATRAAAASVGVENAMAQKLANPSLLRGAGRPAAPAGNPLNNPAPGPGYSPSAP